MKKYSLFHHVVKLNVSNEIRAAVCDCWAEKMENENHKLQAAILYRQGGNAEQSRTLFLNRSRWKFAIASSNHTSSKEQNMNLKLESSMPASQAGQMAWTILKDPEEAVRSVFI